MVGAVIATDGKQGAADWLAGIKRNAQIYQDDEAVVAAVNRGDVASGVINAVLLVPPPASSSAPSKMHSKVHYFPNQDVGAIENVSGAAVLASTGNRKDAERFVEFLVSPAGQRIIANGDDFEYPTRPGVAPNPALPSLAIGRTLDAVGRPSWATVRRRRSSSWRRVWRDRIGDDRADRRRARPDSPASRNVVVEGPRGDGRPCGSSNVNRTTVSGPW